MRNKYVTKCLSVLTACAITLQVPVTAYATDYNSVLRALPSAGVGYHFAAEQVSLSTIKQEVSQVPSGGSAGVSTAVASNGGVVTEPNKLPAGLTASVLTARENAETREAAKAQEQEIVDVHTVSGSGALTSLAAQEVLNAQAADGTAEQATTQTADAAAQTTAEQAATQTAEQTTAQTTEQTTTQTADAATAQTETQTQTEGVLGATKLPSSGTVIARVSDFVNVREQPDVYSEAVGKMHANAVGNLLETVAGGEWALVESGNVRGYVKSEFLVFGAEADAMLDSVATTIATVTADELNVRASSSTDSEIYARVSNGEKLTVVEELDEWVRVAINGEEGYLFKEYVSLVNDYVRAESREEEAARIARASELEQERIQTLAQEAKQESSTPSEDRTYQSAENYVTSYSDKGSAVVAFALQFVGNPYVWGGTSLTHGCDCSGFTMSVYDNFGVKISHASDAQAYVGYPVDGLENAMPGDIISYPGHVALYMGDGQIVHASHPGVGIIVSSAYYTPAIAVRRIFID
ncbi:MAG: SH3 domain-containing protein [Lachnospiraceae bacterium]|nr:SH3 domain-containing protein [Lachnospiraceae bacterium]